MCMGLDFLCIRTKRVLSWDTDQYSSRLISIRLGGAHFNITIIQVYAPPAGHDDSEVDHFYQQLQETMDQTLKKGILVVQYDLNAKVGKNAQADWGRRYRTL